jgi:D-specific alpha-keto acid dehydrogenase
MALRDARGLVGTTPRQHLGRSTERARDLCELTVGVVGAGRIGTAVVRRLQGFGCRVLACSRRSSAVEGAEVVPLDELLHRSDIVSLHVPLTEDSHHLIGGEQLAAMKPGALLVNTARGALVDTTALLEALETGWLGGVALDVLEDEERAFPVDHDAGRIDHEHLHRLQHLPNAVVTPHAAHLTRRMLHDTVEQTLAACLRFEGDRAHAQTDDRHPVRGLLGRA